MGYIVRRVPLILFVFLFPSYCFPESNGLAAGFSMDYFRHAENTGGSIPNLCLSYHPHIYNAVIGGEASTCFFMGGIKGLLGYRFTPGPIEATPILTWGYYLFWLDSASGPGVGLILNLKDFPLSIVTSLNRYRTKDEPAYTGYWTHLEMAYNY